MKNAYVRTAEKTGLKTREGQETGSCTLGRANRWKARSTVQIRHDRVWKKCIVNENLEQSTLLIVDDAAG